MNTQTKLYADLSSLSTFGVEEGKTENSNSYIHQEERDRETEEKPNGILNI
jgi:hypothetical protein